MMLPSEQWLIAALLAAAIATAALRFRVLAPSGAIAAVLMGTFVVGTGGWWAGVALVAFFSTSSLLSRLNRQSTIHQARGFRRDWVQVLANGWGIIVGSLLFAYTEWQPWLLFGIGAIAAATADTWSSEIGRTATSPPRLVTTWQPVARGTSGAVSVRGLLASVAGAGFIASIAVVASGRDELRIETDITVILIALTLAGFFGGLADSFVGAAIQEQRFCDVCNGRTESNPHSCGTPTRHVGGIRGFNNDVVNFVCVLIGALIGLFSGIL